MDFLDQLDTEAKGLSVVDEQKKRLEEVIEWGVDKGWFDDTFIKSLLKRVEGGKELTPKQLSAFENVEDMVENHEDRDEYDREDYSGVCCNPRDLDDIPF